jgi:hypothetical protein
MSALAALPAVPIATAALLFAVHSASIRRWIEMAASAIVLFASIGLAMIAEPPSASILVAALSAITALTDASEPGKRHRVSQAARQIRLAAILGALTLASSLLVWLALAIAGAASAAIRLPRFRAALSQLLPCNAALGLALFGAVALHVGSVQIGCIALLLGWGTLVLLDTAMLPLTLLLALRLQTGLVETAYAPLVGNLMLAGGLADLLLIAAIVLLRTGTSRYPVWLTLAQGGVVLCAFGVGGPEMRFAGLLHLTLLVLSRSAVLLSSEQGLDRLASLAGLSGLPPFGVFPSLALIVFGIAIRMPWLLLPLMVALLVVGWGCITRLPQDPGRLNTSPAWIPLLAGVVVGIALPSPIAGWFVAAADVLR